MSSENSQPPVADIEKDAETPGPQTVAYHGPNTVVAAPPPFSIFTSGEKWVLIGMAAAAGFFSPMTANIYFPAIPLLASDFNISVSLMNLTVTVYLIFQGVSPMFWAPIADYYGRRPVFICCLSLLCIMCVALALVPLDKWWLLLVFRCFQASGSASTVALGSGVVSDLATPQERGGFLGFVASGPLIGPCIGPILGGVIGGSLGWRWIFWFMCIISGTCAACLTLILPETLRRIVGDGSIRAPWWNRPLIPLVGPYRRSSIKEHHQSKVPTTPSPAAQKQRMNPFRFFLEPDVIFMLLSNGLVYVMLVSMQTTMSLLFEEAYPYLTQTDVGLCFLPMGVGSLISAVTGGKLLDRLYKRERRVWEAQLRAKKREAGESISDEEPLVPTREEELTFPIEKARLKLAGPFGIIVALAGVAFGWTLDKKVSLAAPLIFSFVNGFFCIGQMNSFQTLLIDAFPKAGSSTTAINNFVRCLLGAGVTSVINLILDAIGAGWTYVLLGAICGICTPICNILVLRYGPRCRSRRFHKGPAGS